MRRLVLLATALAVGVSLTPFAEAKPPAHVAPVSDATGPLDNAGDVAQMQRFEALAPEHDIGGMYTPLIYDAWPHLDPTAKVVRLEGPADSGNYTGVYLAAQSYRYAQAKAELAKLGVDPLSTKGKETDAVLFWRGQRDEARARGTEMVEYFHLLTNISKYWKTEFSPSVNGEDPQANGFIRYGGGLVPAEAGLLMRTCTPVDIQPSWKGLQNTYGGLLELKGPFDWEDGQKWYCLAGTSRDSYAGTIFGMGVALDFLGTPENSRLRDLLARDLIAVSDYAVKYLWNQPRPHGDVVTTGNDLQGPISPLFIQVPLQRLHLSQTAKHAAHVLGDASAITKWDAVYASEAAGSILGGQLAASMAIDSENVHDTYYKFQLHWMCFFNTVRLETDPVLRGELMRAMGILDATITDDGNAFYQAISYALTGERARLDDAVSLHHQWLDYYAFHEETARQGVTPFLHTPRCSVKGPVPPDAPLVQQPLTCVPKDRVDMHVGGRTLPFRPGTDSKLRALDPLPVGVRRLADFLWQKDPTIIGGDHDIPWRGPSIDFLGTYWMLRYYSEVAVPALSPYPAYSGPTYS